MRRNDSGFTLVELMIVVAVIGILTSIALPEFHRYQLRSRAAERGLMMKQVAFAVNDAWARLGRYPQDTGPGTSIIACPPNPLGPPTTVKRMFRLGLGDWSSLTMTVEGNLYFSYDVAGFATPVSREHIVTAEGDLDGDGVHSLVIQDFPYRSDVPTGFFETAMGGAF